MPRKALLLLHHFPPSESIAAQRSRRLLAPLLHHGVLPVVVTSMDEEANPPSGPGRGHRAWTDRLEEVDGSSIRVVRVRGLDPVAWLQRRARGRPPEPAEDQPQFRAKRWKRWLRGLAVPDEKVGWIPAWLRAAEMAASGGDPFDLVYSSSAPWSTHLAARRISRSLSIPWVMEMRDLWSGNRYQPQTENPLSRLLVDRMEARSVRGAARVVVLTQAHAARLAVRYPSDASRVRIVRNAFDPPRPGEAAPVRSLAGPLRLLCSGSFYGGRNLRALGRAVDSATGRLPGFDGAILEVAGQTHDRPWSDLLGGRDRRRIHGRVSAERVRFLQREAHAGIVHNPSWDEIHVPGKLYEYIGAGLPVLDLTRQPEIPSLCGSTVPCWKVDPEDAAALAEAIQAIAGWWVDRRGLSPLPDGSHPLAAPQIGRDLAQVFVEATQEEARPGRTRA